MQFSLFRALALGVLVLGLSLGSHVVLAQAYLSPAAQHALATAGPEGRIPVYALLHEQAELDKINADAHARGLSRQARNTLVIKSMREQNQRAQAALVADLEAMSTITNVRSRWIVNLVGFSASAADIERLRADPRIAAIHYDGPWVFEQVETVTTTVRPDGAEPGLRAIDADKMWARGYTGFGSVAFTADTGVDPFHPALNHKYAGHDGRLAAFFDPTRDGNPRDCAQHGTHVNGTIMGLDRVTNDTTGVAPNAHWIGGAILCGQGTSDNLQAFEWALDPDGDTISLDRPIVINNSWHDPAVTASECTDNNPYPLLLDNLFNAGVAVVFSAGNAGPEPMTITAPHSYNSSLVNAFTVGALNGNSSSFDIASFSSRGPSSCPVGVPALDIKPEVSAPGVDVRSTVPGGYGRLSGTSMAAPHVSGAILLLHEAFPELDGEQLMLSLYYSARDLGPAGEDNTFGRGIINVEDAYNYLLGQGHEPAPVARPALGANVVSSQVARSQCGARFSGSMLLENVGTTLIDSLHYTLTLNGVSSEGNIFTSIAPGQRAEIALDLPSTALGEQFGFLRITQLNGVPADPRFDLGSSFRVNLTAATQPELVVQQTNGTLCLGSPVLLELVSDIDDRRVSYFDPDPNFLYIGDSLEQRFLVRSLDSAITLYGVNEYRRSGGPQHDYDQALTEFASGTAATLNFRSLRAGTVRSVRVFAEATGRLFMEVHDSADESVGRATPLLRPGWNHIVFRAELEANANYRVVITRSPKLGFVPNLSVSATIVPGMVDFGFVNTDQPELRNSSYFFFDWEVGYTDGCAPNRVDLEPDSTQVAEQREVAILTPEPVANKELVVRDASPVPGPSYRWLVGGEIVPATEPMVSVTPADAGPLEVAFFTTDANACATMGDTVLNVLPFSSSVDDLSVVPATRRLSPNPSRDHFRLSGGEGEIVSLHLYDMTGRLVQTYTPTAQQFSVSHLSAAVYQLRLERQDGKAEVYRLEVLR